MLTASTYVGDGMLNGITYANIDALNINLSDGNDHFTVASTPHGSTLFLYGGDETAMTNQTNDVIDITSTGGLATVDGGDGNDVIRVNYDEHDNQTFQNGLADTLTLHGGNGSDEYDIGLSGQPNADGKAQTIINVLDDPTDPGDLGVNQLVIYGTDAPDYFLLRANQEVVPATAMVAAFRVANGQPVLDGVMERVNYDGSINGDLEIFGRDGDDTFVLDDNLAPTTIFGDDGNDTFQIGQLYASPRDGTNPNNGLDPADYFETTPTTQGFLSNGVSAPTTIFGGNGDDSFTVYRNLAELFLYGQADNDTFTVRAFVKVNPNDPKAPFVNINGGAGADFISYTVDAPVRIDGGDGLDTLVVLGTEFGDDFVVTDKGIFGAGLYITYSGIEKVVVDGEEGNDRFYVASSSPNVEIELVGGLGSDTFDVGGNGVNMPITVVSNSLDGHSGLIAQLVQSADVDYNNLPAQWVSANVGDNDSPGVMIQQVSPIVVFENATAPTGMVQNRFSIVLAQAPTENVRITLAPTALSEQQALAGGKNIELDGSDNGVTLLVHDRRLVPTPVRHRFRVRRRPRRGHALRHDPGHGRAGCDSRRRRRLRWPRHPERHRRGHRRGQRDRGRRPDQPGSDRAGERPPRGGEPRSAEHGRQLHPGAGRVRDRAEQAADRQRRLPGDDGRRHVDLRRRRRHVAPGRERPRDRHLHAGELEHDAGRLREGPRRQHRPGPPLLRDHAGHRQRPGPPPRPRRERRRAGPRRRRQRRPDRPLQRHLERLDRHDHRPGLHRVDHEQRVRRHLDDQRRRLDARVPRRHPGHADAERHGRRRATSGR